SLLCTPGSLWKRLLYIGCLNILPIHIPGHCLSLCPVYMMTLIRSSHLSREPFRKIIRISKAAGSTDAALIQFRPARKSRFIQNSWRDTLLGVTGQKRGRFLLYRDEKREPLMVIRDLKKYYPVRGSTIGKKKPIIHAVDGVDFEIYEGETLGIVGESGCGKSTIGRQIVALEKPT